MNAHVRRFTVLASATACAALATSLSAFQFTLGTVDGSFDTTLSLGGSFRLQDPSPDYYGVANGGRQYSVNADDGNLNYEAGLYSLAAKGTSDLELKYNNFRAFARATYLYDIENMRGDRARTALTDQALDKVGSYFDMLDYFVSGQFELGEMPLDLRVGSQVLSWGESTFIQNGINVINPLDVARLRVPGAELKEALVPVPMISGSLGISENITLEAFYQLVWDETQIDPPGTYFSTNDFAGRGGKNVYLGFGQPPISDRSSFGAIPRGPNSEAGNSGQYGLAARILAPGLGNTEFGLYYVSYHSRLPLISAITPTQTRAQMSTNIQAIAGQLGTQILAPALIAGGIPASQVPASITALLGASFLGYPQSALPAALQPYYPTAQSITRGATTTGFLNAAATGRYVIEYPEDIDMLGVSFNSDLGNTGISLQGEVSYKTGVPLQCDDVELLFAALGTLSDAYGNNNQFGNYANQYGTRIQGWKRKDVWQGQVTGTKVFGSLLGADQWVLVAELGATWVPDLPPQDVMRMDGSGSFTGGDPAAMAATGNAAIPVTEASLFADEFSAGYQLAARFDYTNVLFGGNLSPSIGFSHDVSGNTPLPLGNFIDGRKSLTLAAEYTYLNSWGFELRYVNYFGAKEANLLNDRDFVSATFKYSF
ncbi:MAG: DUF1302 domain-containing protein [Opitutaceae bacterium]|nr:DUF1302 domain-containing protein [Opitutaceae bacterium]